MRNVSVSGLFEIALPRSKKSRDVASQIREKLHLNFGEFYAVIEGIYEISILAHHRERQALSKLVRRIGDAEIRDGLGAVTVAWPRTTKDIPGIYYRITRSLALRGISIQSFHTLGAEMVVIVRENDLMNAFEALQAVLYQN